MTNKLTIMGAGNVGHALAFDAANHGVEVMLYEHPKFSDKLKDIEKAGGITSVESLEVAGKSMSSGLPGFAKISHVTSDLQTAIDFSDVLCLTIPSYAQEIFFESIAPFLKENQVLILISGNCGVLAFKKILKDLNITVNIILIETNSSPYAVRVINPAEIYILGKKRMVGAASLPVEYLKEHHDYIESLIQTKINPLENVLEVAMSNVNLIIHVATAVLGMGPMESRQGAIQFYKEGASQSVSKVLEQEDLERIRVGKSYKLNLKSFVENMNNFYGLSTKDIYDFSQNTAVHNAMPNDSPKSPQERYISEDCPFGLVPVYSLAEKADIDCPVMKSIITIAGVYNEINYFKTGRTLDKLGMEAMSVEEIIEYVN